MRLFAALALGVFVVCAQANELKYRVVIQGQEIGEATLSQTVLPNRGVRSKFNMTITGPGGQMKMSVDETTGPDGTPIKGTMTQSSPQGEVKSARTFGAKSVVVVSTKDGKTTTKTIAYPKTGSLKSVSTLWFVTVKPKVGAKDNSVSLREEGDKWEASVDTYVGIKQIASKGKTVKAHYITSKDTRLWVDDKGMPYQIEFNEQGLTILVERK